MRKNLWGNKGEERAVQSEGIAEVWKWKTASENKSAHSCFTYLLMRIFWLCQILKSRHVLVFFHWCDNLINVKKGSFMAVGLKNYLKWTNYYRHISCPNLSQQKGKTWVVLLNNRTCSQKSLHTETLGPYGFAGETLKEYVIPILQKRF